MLGDSISSALSQVGITPERVEQWLGVPCGCEERVLKLNQLHIWALRVLRGKTERAREFLCQILEQYDDPGHH